METKFYCNKCRNEVAPNANQCPYCGERFNAVQCPVCKLIGTPDTFMRGCPSCGYVNPQQEMGNRAKMQKSKDNQLNKKKHKKNSFRIVIPPGWYKIILLIFILILAILLYLLYRLF